VGPGFRWDDGFGVFPSSICASKPDGPYQPDDEDAF
jgi:hypothetical protein